MKRETINHRERRGTMFASLWRLSASPLKVRENKGGFQTNGVSWEFKGKRVKGRSVERPYKTILNCCEPITSTYGFKLAPTKTNRLSVGSLLLVACLYFAACIPAQTPPHLSATPGAGAIISDDTYRNDRFSAAYPAGWRVITSEAGAAPSVTFVAPGNCALIVVSSAPIEQPPAAPPGCAEERQTVERSVTIGDTQVALAGSAPLGEWDAFMREVERVAESIGAGK